MVDIPCSLPPKRDVAQALLEGDSLFVHLDPRRDQVQVPESFRTRPQLVLHIGVNMPIPIPDLAVDEDGLSCTLSFRRQPFWCHLPWSAIYAMVGTDGRGMVWPEDVPREVAAQVKRPEPRPKKRSRPRAERRLRQRALEAQRANELAYRGEDANDSPSDGTHVDAKRAREAPRLRALPSPQQRAPSRQSPSLDTPARAQAPASSPRPPQKGRKRPLPPYLRVIK